MTATEDRRVNQGTPIVNKVEVASGQRDGETIAIVRFTDDRGAQQIMEFTERAVWSQMIGSMHFLRVAHRTGCQGCGEAGSLHPNEQCHTWH